MKFPITREQLLTFDPVKNQEEEDEIALSKHIPYTLHAIEKAFKEFMMHPKKTPEMTVFTIYNIEYMRSNIRNYLDERLNKKEVYYPRLLEELRKNYVGCSISLDYNLTISWTISLSD